MDFELQRMLLDGHQLTVDTVISLEETAESIVPDAFPDISRIVSASGTACLNTKQVLPGSLKVVGTANVCVLYIPEDSQSLRALNVKIPFQCSADDPKIKESDHLHTTIISVDAEARLMNPRKLFVKTEVKLSAKVYSQYRRELVCDLADKEDPTIQKKWQKSKHYAITALLEKPFSFSDTLHLPSSKPSIDDILTYSITPRTIEARYIGKKLVCKGELTASVLYSSGSDLNTAQFDLPFSQILDLESSFDEGNPDVSLYLKHTECTLRDGDLDVTVDAALQAGLWAHKDIALLSDLYSTAMALEVERSVECLCISCEQETQKEPVRKFCESGIPASNVLSCSHTLGPVTMQQNGQRREYHSEANVCILYRSEDNVVCAVEYTIPILCSKTIETGISSCCFCRTVGDVVAVPVTGGFEVRFEVEFVWLNTEHETIAHVTAVKECKSVSTFDQKPSVIIRVVGTGETLWDIAKACNATIPDICCANELQSEHAEVGAVLLIPTKR